MVNKGPSKTQALSDRLVKLETFRRHGHEVSNDMGGQQALERAREFFRGKQIEYALLPYISLQSIYNSLLKIKVHERREYTQFMRKLNGQQEFKFDYPTPDLTEDRDEMDRVAYRALNVPKS